VVYWIYTAVGRHIVTYAATVWWPRFKFKTSRAELSKLQRIACLGITGAVKTTPTMVIEILHSICSWKRRPKQEFIDWIAMINGNPNQRVLDMHA
jgi:hypothetical protein